MITSPISAAPGAYVVRADVSVSHKSRAGQHVTILAACGDLFDNGNQWFEVECADGEMTHLMAKEMDPAPRTARLSGRDVIIIGETPSPWNNDTTTWLDARRVDNGVVVSAPAEYYIFPDETPQEFDNREMLAQMSEAAQAGTPGMETHPHYRPVDDLRGEDLCEVCVRENGRPDLAAAPTEKWCSLCGGRVGLPADLTERCTVRTFTAFSWILNETTADYAVAPFHDGPMHGPEPMPARIDPADVASATRIALTAAMDRMPTAELERVTPGQLVVGDLVAGPCGLVLLVTDAPRLSTAHAGDRTFYTDALVCNREAVPNNVVPFGWTDTGSSPARGLPAEPTGTHRWTIQGNDLATEYRYPRS